MENYKQIALRYLKLNKNRSIITVIGTAITVAFLFVLLNLGWSFVLQLRTDLRQEQDYEVVFMTETKEQIDQIIKNPRVKSASVGSYYFYDYYEPKTYDNAVYVNFTNPYNMGRNAKDISNQVDVKFDYNAVLAITYMQGGDDYLGVIICCLILFISFIFAIFGVGIVRNSIQLCTLEQIKDYGNLRCVGATKGQLKSIIYLEGAILEIIGIVIGLVVGTLASLIAGLLLNLKAGFHFLPVVPVLIAFLGDLYFVMEENCKVVTNMTPVSAIRGTLRIKKEKIRRRHSGLIGKVLGIEGDYAYKNMMRNPFRFMKTTGAIGIGVAAFIATIGIVHTLSYLEREMEETFGYYHVYVDAGYIAPTQTIDEIKAYVPPKNLENMKTLPGIVEAKQVYCAQILLSNWKDVYSHYTDDYFQHVTDGEAIQRCGKTFDEVVNDNSGATKNIKKSAYINCLAGVKVYGYDEEDLVRYKDVLVDGTIDVGENEILLVNHCKTTKEDYDDLERIETIEVDFTDYKVGDTIDFIDTEQFRALFLERVARLNEKYNDVYQSLSILQGSFFYDSENSASYDENVEKRERLQARYDSYMQEKALIYVECYNDIIKQGAYKTYRVAGILNGDANRTTFTGIQIVVPLKQYYEMSGTKEGDSIGMQYHFNNFPVVKYNNTEILGDDGFGYNYIGETCGCYLSYYPEFRGLLMEFKGTIIGLVVFVLFVVLISCINIINTTASNIHLRRQEFAQLRVIGVSKRGLVKMVLLEGVISSILANLIGIIVGVSISYGMVRMSLTILYGYQYHIPWEGILIGLVISTIVLCGSIYLPLKKLDNNMAECLATGNE